MISRFRAFKINLSNEADDNNRRVTNTCRYQNCVEKGEQAMLRRQHSGVQHSGNYYDEFEGIQKPAAQATNQQRGRRKAHVYQIRGIAVFRYTTNETGKSYFLYLVEKVTIFFRMKVAKCYNVNLR